MLGLSRAGLQGQAGAAQGWHSAGPAAPGEDAGALPRAENACSRQWPVLCGGDIDGFKLKHGSICISERRLWQPCGRQREHRSTGTASTRVGRMNAPDLGQTQQASLSTPYFFPSSKKNMRIAPILPDCCESKLVKVSSSSCIFSKQ